MKKKVLLILGIVLVLATTTTSLAYFTSKETTPNNFTTGSVRTEVYEGKFQQNSELPSNNNPVDKCVKVINTGENPVLVRVIINPQWDEEKDKDGKVIKPITSASNQVKLNFSDSVIDNWTNGSENGNWIKGNDGYYYYNKVLEPKNKDTEKSVTKELLKSVSLKENIPNDEKEEYQNRNLTVNVSSEAIQVNEKALNEKALEDINRKVLEDKWNLNETDKNAYDNLKEIIEKYNKN